MIKFIISGNVDNYIDKLNKISLDQQTAMAEAAEATVLKLQQINPEYGVVRLENDNDTFLITASNVGDVDDVSDDAKEFFKETFRESFIKLTRGV
jgi:hypothetical protein